jgi:hypothetical protein
MNFRLPFPHVFSSLPDFAMGLAFLATWIDPYSLGNDMPQYLLLVMLMEFIIIHSAGFMGVIIYGEGDRKRRILFVIGLGFFYSLFVVGFALAFGEWWPLWAFWILIFNRLMSGLFEGDNSETKKKFVMGMWAVGVFCYLVGVFATTLLPVPELGITPQVISGMNLSGGGVWIDEPYRVLAFGFFYFTAVGLFEFFASRWINKMEAPNFRITPVKE